MMLFGLGTVPMMTAVVYAKFINLPFEIKFKKAIPYVVLIGLLFILRGLGLDSYVSPANTSLYVQATLIATNKGLFVKIKKP
jgi:uncharacterized membrane protein